ncbi:hypothetical protein NQZ68_003457 [Dissostichus eleginoides]|nr:hypothetical protein NQZ68_003457 [Dissostichus eleginoides]
MARPQACCPNSTLAAGKVEAEGVMRLQSSEISEKSGSRHASYDGLMPHFQSRKKRPLMNDG